MSAVTFDLGVDEVPIVGPGCVVTIQLRSLRERNNNGEWQVCELPQGLNRTAGR